MGKVHGSLARAGKVKGQTPKVEAQEKKKQPRGRAKKRMQYNRRYVNVVTGMGGKKVGPNSNADKMKSVGLKGVENRLKTIYHINANLEEADDNLRLQIIGKCI